MGDGSVTTSTSTKKKRMKNPFKSLARGISTKKKKKNKDDASVVSNTVIASNTNGAATSTSRNGIPSRVGGQQQQGVRSNYRPASSSSSANNKPSATNSSSSSSIQVVLLLMDPQTRRFELLQLEFDSQKALVNDVLRQITTSATETSLREMDYSGVCDVEGKEMVGGERLAKFCSTAGSNSDSVVDVVMAMPAGMGGVATANLARPILGDPKVVEMLHPCGVNLENILVKRPKQVYFNNPKTTSTSGDGTMSASTNLTQINEEDDDDDDDDNNDKKTRDYNSPAAKAERARKRAKKKGRAAGGGGGGGLKEKLTSVPTLALTSLFVAMVAYAVKLHVRVTQPITLTSNLLLPGEWKSTCGILDVLPQQLISSRAVQYVGGMMKNDKCSIDSTTPLSSSMLEMGKDGTLRYFTTNDDGERKEAWSVVGDYSDGGGGNANGNTASCVKEDANGQCLQMQKQQDENRNSNNNNNKGATFVKENESWYVIMGKTRTALNKDVIREFTL